MTAIWKRCFQKAGFDYSPIVLQPGHLNGADDSVYYFFPLPSLVGLKLPEDVRHFNMIPWYAKRNLAAKSTTSPGRENSPPHSMTKGS
jgi:hypothetical protein